MARRVLVAVASLVFVSGCASEAGHGFCDIAAEGLVPLDAADAPARWAALEAAAPPTLRADVGVLRVIAEQIDRLGPERRFSDVAALAMTGSVTAAHRAVRTGVEERCGPHTPD